ncbi:single-stranded-DNA-specific exonuclease RecJ [Almyronema epifaneia]|uniref:Single-stranded-DNA-specific exonuclease RecJ n=1 Tax=Almyronema epifaneia S1 TaxID=2991925 RepID=A0ABW6IDE4_9CYAN
MVNSTHQWQLQPSFDLSEEWLQAVQQQTGLEQPQALAQLLWQRGIRSVEQLPGFFDPQQYQPTSAFEFGSEMQRAVDRLKQAHQQGEKVAIWGDFDADGVTATAVLWEGLGQFFVPDQQLTYVIPNRLKESHGLHKEGLIQLAAAGYTLVVTCDTGSTHLSELNLAQQLGLAVIVSDHHTLPDQRPPVQAIINPRYLPTHHPLAHLSGVAVAYKLVEALYQTLPDVPQQPLDQLIDLVAIGLIADLVELKGDCRYLAQMGIQKLQQRLQPAPTDSAYRPGVAELLMLCKRSGDRPTDISFGIGPRINAVSRIHGDASFCVELLTSRDPERCRQLATETELANTRRKALQRDLMQQVTQRLQQIDLSTTHVIVLADTQWPTGILGLVAGQIAQQYHRPTLLLSIDPPSPDGSAPQLARGSARSPQSIDLYQLVQTQTALLHSFGGHPYAAGLSLPVENIALFSEAINRQLREQQSAATLAIAAIPSADLKVTVAELGKSLFQQLKQLEPCGMGNPVPRLLLRNCWFSNARNYNLRDYRGGKVRYIKTEFDLCDATASLGFPGHWWEHYRDDLPTGTCDVIVELDFNTYKKRYEVRLLAVRPAASIQASAGLADWLVDQRTVATANVTSALRLQHCPTDWQDFQPWLHQAVQKQQALTLAYSPPVQPSPQQIVKTLLGIAKYLHRTQQWATRPQLLARLTLSDRTLNLALVCLEQLGFELAQTDQGLQVKSLPATLETTHSNAIATFVAAIQEEQFRRQYFYQVPLATLQTTVQQMLGNTV